MKKITYLLASYFDVTPSVIVFARNPKSQVTKSFLSSSNVTSHRANFVYLDIEVVSNRPIYTAKKNDFDSA